MVKFIIDNNLPYRFSHWNDTKFIFVKNLNSKFSDAKIWDIAKEENLTIVTKDADFYNRIIVAEPPPRVIHFRIGNMNLNAFHDFIGQKWSEIESLSNQYKLVIVFNDRIEAIE